MNFSISETPSGNAIWGARPVAVIGDSKVQLYWENPMPYILTFVRISDPDEFDIFISENDMSDFRKIAGLKIDEGYSYTVDKLQNGKPCFFYTVSKKKGFEPVTSDIIMAVPNQRLGFETLQTNEEGHTVWSVSIAHNKNKIAYVDGHYTWERGAVIISNMDGSEKELVNTDSYGPSWSPENDKIVFYTRDWTKPAQILLYDCNTKSITPLTDGKRNCYTPVFSENGELILFEAAKDIVTNGGTVTVSSETDETDIWLIDLKTPEPFQVTDINAVSAIMARQPCWIDNDRFLFYAFENNNQLYESSVSNRQINKVFDSQWNDSYPSISPDKKKIAFISDRSGEDAIWIYHIDNKTYSQLSGYSSSESIWSSGSYVQWLDNVTVVYTINGNRLVKQKIE